MEKSGLQDLSQEIVLLRILTAEPATPKRKAIVNFEEASLPLLLRELDVVDNLTFICAISGNPENVIALCIEEGIQPNSCTFRIAMNTKVPKELLDGIRAIAQVLEKADSRNYSNDVESLVTVVMHMNRNRILVRLRSIHAGPHRRSDRTATVRRLQVMVENLKSTASQGSARSRLANLQSTANEIGLAFTLLEASNTEAVIAGERDELIIRVLSLLNNLPSAKDLTHMLTFYALPRDQRFQGPQDLVNTITKPRKYRASCESLSKAASATTIFRNITVAEVSIRRSPNTRGTPPSLMTCLRRMNLAWDQGMNNRFETTLTSLSDQLRNEMANFKPKIHAEIQLVFFYEQYSDLQRPRILCSSKSACFLCNLFVGLHGKLLVRRTHGVLYPKWTLPAVDEVSLCNEARQTMSRLVGQLRTELQAEICKVLQGTRPKRTHPAESLFSLQFWSGSDNSVVALPAVEKDNIGQSVSGIVSQSFSHANHLIRNDDAEMDTDKHTLVRLLPSNLALETHDVKASNQTLSGASQSSTGSTDGCDILPENMATSTAMDRLPCDLDCEELHNTAQSIKDHGSRSYDVRVAHDASNDQKSDTLCATSTCRRIDFHELELFVETELAASVEVTEIARPTLGEGLGEQQEIHPAHANPVW